MSARAQRMLEHGKRYPHPADRGQIIDCLQRSDLPVFEPVVAFEEEFGGVAYHIRGTGDGLLLGIAPAWAAPSGPQYWRPERLQKRLERPVWATQHGGEWFFECCAWLRHAEEPPLLKQTGELWTLDGLPTPVASSTRVYIEGHALLDELIELQPTWVWLLFGDRLPRGDRRLDAQLNSLGLPVFPEATDAFTAWWGTDRVRVHRHVFADGTGRYERLVAYTATAEEAEWVSTAVTTALAETRPTRRAWPLQR